MLLIAAAARRSLALLPVLLLVAPSPASASQPEEVLRPRTGPEAASPSAPDFPTPLPSIVPETPSAAPPPSPPAVTVDSVRVDAPGEGLDSVPPRRWRPPADPVSGLRLEHRRGERLDAQWVRRQFALNAIEGGGLDRAVALVQLVNRAFLTAGFVNSGLLVLPETLPGTGLLALRLVHGGLVPREGTAAVEVEWAEGRSAGLDAEYVRRRFPSARRRPVSAVAIERDFRLLADDPAIRTVDAELLPGSSPGEASLRLAILPRERTDLYLTAGNSRSPSVGGERIAAGGLARNLAASGDLISGEVGATRGVLDASLAYSAPLFTPRTSLSFRGSFNRAAVVDRPLAPLDIRTRDRGAEIGLAHRLVDQPLVPAGDGGWSSSRRLSAGLAFAWRRQRSFLLGEPFSFAPGSVDGRAEYRAVRLLADYVVRNVDQVLALSATGTMGLGGTRSDQPLVINPDRNFRSLLVQLNFARRLTPGGLELRVRATGQIAGSPLYSAERLSLGGEASVRGYRESLILADQGLVGSVEVAHPFSLGAAARAGAFDWGAFTVAAFADAGTAWNVQGPDPRPDSLASVGFALAWQPSDALLLRVSYGLALEDARQTGERDLQDRGVHLRFTFYPLRLARGR